jgi:hypothetical protein
LPPAFAPVTPADGFFEFFTLAPANCASAMFAPAAPTS